MQDKAAYLMSAIAALAEFSQYPKGMHSHCSFAQVQRLQCFIRVQQHSSTKCRTAMTQVVQLDTQANPGKTEDCG